MAKKQLCTCSTPFLYISLPSFCPTTTWNFRKLPGYTFYIIFTPVTAAIVIFSPPLQKSCCSYNRKRSPLFFLSRSSSFSRSASLGVALLSLFFCLSLSLYSKFVDMTINLSLILKTTRIQKNFPLSVFVFIDSVVVSASQDEGGRTLSRQNKLTFTFGLHELVCTDGRAYTTS